MSYAIRKDGKGWRSVDGIDDLRPDEDYAEQQPPPLPPPAPTLAQLQTSALAQVRTLRTSLMNVLDGLQSSALATGNAELATQLEAAKQGARDITKVDVSSCTTAGDIANAYKAAWATVAAGAPESVKRLFAEALL